MGCVLFVRNADDLNDHDDDYDDDDFDDGDGHDDDADDGDEHFEERQCCGWVLPRDWRSLGHQPRQRHRGSSRFPAKERSPRQRYGFLLVKGS